MPLRERRRRRLRLRLGLRGFIERLKAGLEKGSFWGFSKGGFRRGYRHGWRSEK